MQTSMDRDQEKRMRRMRALGMFEYQKIDALFEKYYQRYNKGDLVGANKMAWVLSKKYAIEGDKTFDVGSPQ